MKILYGLYLSDEINSVVKSLNNFQFSLVYFEAFNKCFFEVQVNENYVLYRYIEPDTYRRGTIIIHVQILF